MASSRCTLKFNGGAFPLTGDHYYNDAFGSVTPVHGIDFDGDRETPEEAALGSYSPNAEAFVVSTTMHNPRHATVVVDTVPSHPMTSDVRSDLRGRWTECSSGG